MPKKKEFHEIPKPAERDMWTVLEPFYDLTPLQADSSSPTTSFVETLHSTYKAISDEVGAVIAYFQIDDDGKEPKLTELLNEFSTLFIDPKPYVLSGASNWDDEQVAIRDRWSDLVRKAFTEYRRARWESRPVTLEEEAGALLSTAWETFKAFLDDADAALGLRREFEEAEIFNLASDFSTHRYNLGWHLHDLTLLLKPPTNEADYKMIGLLPPESGEAWIRSELLKGRNPFWNDLPPNIKRLWVRNKSFNSAKARALKVLVRAGLLP